MIVVAAATALPKGMIIPKMKKGIPSTGRFEDMHVEKFKGPPRRAFFSLARALRALESSEGSEKKYWRVLPNRLITPPQLLSDPQIFHSTARFGAFELSVISVRGSGMNFVGESVTMN